MKTASRKMLAVFAGTLLFTVAACSAILGIDAPEQNAEVVDEAGTLSASPPERWDSAGG